MPKISIQQKNWLLSAHIGFAALWTGAVLSMGLIAYRNTHSDNPGALFALNSAINLLDDFGGTDWLDRADRDSRRNYWHFRPEALGPPTQLRKAQGSS